MPELTLPQWLLAIAAAVGIGFSKSGFAGVSLFHVIAFAYLLGPRESTGALLPMLIVGDVCAVLYFRQHARWDYVRRILPPALIGIVLGWAMMQRLNDAAFHSIIGGIVLVLALLQLARMYRPEWFLEIPHAPWFAYSLGFLAGVTTMLANAAGPVVVLYLLAVSLPKFEFVGTAAWFFLIINVFKVPFSVSLGLIDGGSLAFNAVLVPAIVAGILLGRWLVQRISQQLFDTLMLLFAIVAALRLLGAF